MKLNMIQFVWRYVAVFRMLIVYHISVPWGWRLKRSEGDWLSCDAFEKGLRLSNRVYDIWSLLTGNQPWLFWSYRGRMALLVWWTSFALSPLYRLFSFKLQHNSFNFTNNLICINFIVLVYLFWWFCFEFWIWVFTWLWDTL